MLTRTKWMMAGIGTLLLVGTAFVGLASADDSEVDADVAASSSWHDGKWTKDGSIVTGQYVSFGFDAATGSLSNYSEQGRTIFTSVSVADYNASDAKAQAHGRLIATVDGDLLRGAIFDARNAAFMLRAPTGNTVTLVAADGIALEYHAGDKGWSPQGVLLRDGSTTMRLVTDGDANVTVSGQTITVVLGEHSGLHFKIDGHPWEAAKEKLALLKLAKKAREHGKGKGLDKGNGKGKGRDRGDA